jgi:cell division protein FtsW
LAALANGGVFGVGLGVGNQKFGPLPLAHTDGVFAIVGEELGLMGTLTLIALLVFTAWRGFRVAARARDTYGFLLAVGITVWISYQALINVAVITAVIPFTGMPSAVFQLRWFIYANHVSRCGHFIECVA